MTRHPAAADHARRPTSRGRHDHDHAHGLTATGRHRSRLIIAVAITASIVIVQIVGGLLSGSLALLADAGHMLTDSAGLLIALVASMLSVRPATNTRTYGLQRVEILAALTNGMLLIGVAVWVLIRAVQRWGDPEPISTGLMLGVAIVGAVANTVSLLVLRGGRHERLNLRGAYLEVLGDLLGSLAVIIAAIVIMATGFTRADTIASLLIFVLIVPRAWSLLRDVVDVLLEATPREIDLTQVRQHIRDLPGVVDVHDLHAWTITSGSSVLSAHVVVDDDCFRDGEAGATLDRLTDCLAQHFELEHCTFQLEPVGHRGHEPAHHA